MFPITLKQLFVKNFSDCAWHNSLLINAHSRILNLFYTPFIRLDLHITQFRQQKAGVNCLKRFLLLELLDEKKEQSNGPTDGLSQKGNIQEAYFVNLYVSFPRILCDRSKRRKCPMLIMESLQDTIISDLGTAVSRGCNLFHLLNEVI